MNKSIFSLIFGVTFFCIYYLINIPVPNSTLAKTADYKSLNSVADDGFFAARAYPDAFIDIESYEKALAIAKFQMDELQARNRGAADQWETQGPFNIGARVNTIAVHPQNEKIIYLGFSRGGVFKTVDGGISWKPIFDEQPFLSIGVIKIDPKNPEIVYVGTGDPNIGYYSSVGDGIWKSTNGGQSWTNIGLKDQRIISKIEIDPLDSKIIYVAAMGLPFKKTTERGLYKSTDGGLTWNKKLYVSDSTGICDLAINPANPNIIYASCWDRIRNNKTNFAAGFASGIYKSSNGGDNWIKLNNGLPTGKLSRVGITICKSQPNILYSIFVSGEDFNHEGIYRSNDSGSSWQKVANDPDSDLPEGILGGFGWYFSGIDISPVDPEDVFVLGVDLWRSKNGGKNWQKAAPDWSQYNVHADKHDFQRTQSGKFFLATDGGAYLSTDNSATWQDIESIATTQFYRVGYNPNKPADYYGGAQDNGTTEGNANTAEWERVFGGDGFQMRFDKARPAVRFYESQYGEVYYFSDKTQYGEVKNGEMQNDRVHWDAPYDLSKHEDSVLYFGTHRLWKGTYDPDGFEFLAKWTAISPDLTDNDQSPSPNNTITCFDESTLQSGLIYVGTGDANVWRLDALTKKQKNISAGLPERYVSSVKTSPLNVNRVYVSLSGYREFESTPHIWMSNNSGDLWQPISGDLPPLAVNDLMILPNNKDSVLFAATDGGVYFTKNSGKNWLRLGSNMPLIPVFDIDYNEKNNQLIAGTYARSIMTFALKNIGVDSKSIVGLKDEISQHRINVNPVVFQSTIEISDLDGQIKELLIYDLQGKIVYNNRNSFNNIVIDTGLFSSGMYIIACKTDENKKYIRKIIKN
ncbi:MAG: VPS10 domain-containing protein [Saprospiraceae bacterium]